MATYALCRYALTNLLQVQRLFRDDYRQNARHRGETGA
jgi:hypothetical protein